MLKLIPKLLTKEDNNKMTKLLNNAEVKKAVEELNGKNIVGHDGSSGLFFKSVET